MAGTTKNLLANFWILLVFLEEIDSNFELKQRIENVGDVGVIERGLNWIGRKKLINIGWVIIENKDTKMEETRKIFVDKYRSSKI